MTGRGRGCRVSIPTTTGRQPRETVLPGDSALLAMFRNASKHLTERHDRHERLVKQSRDVTIESKRIIFLLHSSATKEKPLENIIAEAKDRLRKLINTHIKSIALEMEHVSTYLHTKAYSAGMQEFVEARTFCSFMEHKKIMTLGEIQEELTFTLKSDEGDERTVSVLLVPLDYMLGLADLSGEIMRYTINGIATKDIDECVFACDVLRMLFTGFMGLFRAHAVLNNKLNTTQANLFKVEHAIYSTKVRGREVIKTSLADAIVTESLPENDDQGFF